MLIARRRLFGFLAAPAIVRVASLMPVCMLPTPQSMRITAAGLPVFDIGQFAGWNFEIAYGIKLDWVLAAMCKEAAPPLAINHLPEPQLWRSGDA